MAVAADPNPWAPGRRPEGDFELFNPIGGKEQKNYGNAVTHQEEGQNVLFLDTHVNFESNSFCGINEDNIYTYQTGSKNDDIRIGIVPTFRTITPYDRTDSILVDDGFFE